jgi:hypothetical protein
MPNIWGAVSGWRWDIIGGISSVISALSATATLYFVSQFEAIRRRRRLLHPGNAFFIIPASFHHTCDYAIQNELEHRLLTIVLPSNSQCIIDLVLESTVEFDTTEIAVGCDGEWSIKPYVTEQCNRFIEVGNRRRVIPRGGGSEDYLDKHHYYHAVRHSQFNDGNAKALGFKIKTLSAGKFHMSLPFSGSTVRGEFKGLTVVVSDTPMTPMHCVDPNHQHRDCAVRIKPRSPS